MTAKLSRSRKRSPGKPFLFLSFLGALLLLFSFWYQSAYPLQAYSLLTFALFLFGTFFIYSGLFLSYPDISLRVRTYLKDSKREILLITFLFFLCAILGFIFYRSLHILDGVLSELVNQTLGLNVYGLVDFIFFNNLKSSFLGSALGIFFGVFPFFNVVLNGAVLGYVFHKVFLISGFTDFWRILPHGIFELPAVFISLGLGLRIGKCSFPLVQSFFQYFWNKSKAVVFAPAIASLIAVVLYLVLYLVFPVFQTVSSDLFFSFLLSGFIASFLILLLLTPIVCLFWDKRFRYEGKEFIRSIKEGLYVFIFMVIPLLIIAAIIEGFLIAFYK